MSGVTSCNIPEFLLVSQHQTIFYSFKFYFYSLKICKHIFPCYFSFLFTKSDFLQLALSKWDVCCVFFFVHTPSLVKTGNNSDVCTLSIPNSTPCMHKIIEVKNNLYKHQFFLLGVGFDFTCSLYTDFHLSEEISFTQPEFPGKLGTQRYSYSLPSQNAFLGLCLLQLSSPRAEIMQWISVVSGASFQSAHHTRGSTSNGKSH